MIIFFHKQLIAFLLIFALLQVPLNSFAPETASGGSQNTCQCEMLLADCGTDEKGEESNHYPGGSANDCCDSEEPSADAAEPQLAGNIKINISARNFSSPNTTDHVPKVYLTIFVPPENCSLA